MDSCKNKNVYLTDEVIRITWWGLVVNVILSFLKLSFGYFGGSHAILADGIHSLSDLITDMAIIVGAKLWSAPPDEDHPYGHSRIENLITAFIGIVLVFAALMISYSVLTTVQSGLYTKPHWMVMVVAIFSIVLKEIIYHSTMRVAKRSNSSALIANAWHHRTDSLSSIPVLIAVAVAVFFPEWSFVDQLGALIVSIFILRVAYTIIKSSISDLIDSGASILERQQIQEICRSVDKVVDFHAVRSRSNGMGLQVDLHILVDENLTVREGHDVAKEVKHKLMSEGPNVVDVLVHVEPYQ